MIDLKDKNSSPTLEECGCPFFRSLPFFPVFSGADAFHLFEDSGEII